MSDKAQWYSKKRRVTEDKADENLKKPNVRLLPEKKSYVARVQNVSQWQASGGKVIRHALASQFPPSSSLKNNISGGE